MSTVGSVDDIWSEVVLISEKNTCDKGNDAGNVWSFGGAVGEFSKKFWHFGLKSIAEWESVWIEGRFDPSNEDGGEDLINDDCDKHGNDKCDNDWGDNTLGNVLIMD